MQHGDPYVWMLALHLAVMGYYLGSDVVVNQMTFYLIASSKVTPQQRTRMRRFQLLCDQHPRMGLILFIATGLSYDILQGWTMLPVEWLPWIWIIALLWIANIWAGFLMAGSPIGQTKLGKTLVQLDLYWRYLMVVAIVGVAGWSLFGDGPVRPKWLALKYLLLGTLMAGGAAMRLWARPLTPAWADYVASGPSPEFEALIGRIQRGAIYLNWFLWCLFGCMILLQLLCPHVPIGALQ